MARNGRPGNRNDRSGNRGSGGRPPPPGVVRITTSERVSDTVRRTIYSETGKPDYIVTHEKTPRGNKVTEISRPTCYPEGTPVLTPAGWQTIEKIRTGDFVLSYDYENGVVQRTVTRVSKCTGTHIIYNLELVGFNYCIRVTGSHTVFTAEGWRRVSKIEPGHDLVIIEPNGIARLAKIINVTHASECGDIYNLITNGEHNFIANRVLSHNFTWLRRTRTLTNRLILDPVRLGIIKVRANRHSNPNDSPASILA